MPWKLRMFSVMITASPPRAGPDLSRAAYSGRDSSGRTAFMSHHVVSSPAHAAGDRPCAVHVTHAEVVRRHRDPRAVGFGNPTGQLVPEHRKIARPAENALARIEAVADAEPVCSLGSQHHHSPHPGSRRRERVPLRFLVCECGEKAPVDTGACLGVMEMPAVSGQARTHVLQKNCHVLVVEATNVPEVAIGDPGEQPAFAGAGEKGVDLGCEALLVDRQGPRDFGPNRQVVGNHDGRLGLCCQRKMHAVGGDEVQFAVSQLFEQRLIAQPGRKVQSQAGNALANALEGLDGCGTSPHADRSTGEIVLAGDLPAVRTADQHIVHLSQRSRPPQRKAFVAGDSGRGEMHLAGEHCVERPGGIRIHDETHRHVEALPQFLQQVVLEPRRLALRLLTVGNRVQPSRDAQFAGRPIVPDPSRSGLRRASRQREQRNEEQKDRQESTPRRRPRILREHVSGGNDTRGSNFQQRRAGRCRLSVQGSEMPSGMRSYFLFDTDRVRIMRPPARRSRDAERWQSGRMYLTRNQA